MALPVDQPASDVRGRVLVSRSEVAVQHHGAQPIFDLADPAARRPLEHLHEFVTVERASGEQGLGLLTLGALARRFKCIVIGAVVVRVARIVGPFELEQVRARARRTSG